MTPTSVVIMGVSAAGKTAVGQELARLLGADFVDADSLHPEANLTKMSAGIPLTDDDRWPWLEIVAEALGAEGGVVVSCSALKRAYRDRLRRDNADAVFVRLTGSSELLEQRALDRTGHFMPPALLQSQLSTLEPLQSNERGVDIDIDAPVIAIAQRALEWLRT